eukprot:scaffold27345_cov26-Tisochrysis_lutea.AAC.1
MPDEQLPRAPDDPAVLAQAEGQCAREGGSKRLNTPDHRSRSRYSDLMVSPLTTSPLGGVGRSKMSNARRGMHIHSAYILHPGLVVGDHVVVVAAPVSARLSMVDHIPIDPII